MGDHHNAIVIFVVLLFFYLSALLFKFKLKYKIKSALLILNKNEFSLAPHCIIHLTCKQWLALLINYLLCVR